MTNCLALVFQSILQLNPFSLLKAKTAYNFGLSKCDRVHKVKGLLNIISLTKSMAVIFFAEKTVRSFCTAKAPQIFQQKEAGIFFA